jgi:hypothetical protein
MKILLDENLPKKLKLDFAGQHSVSSVREMEWLGKKNGELLGLMVLSGFDAFVTIDKNLRHQQNISRFPIMIFVLDSPNNRIDTLQPYIKKLNELLDMPSTSQVTVVSL